MPEGLATADGTAIDLDRAEQEFARAMAAPEPDEPEHPAPPKREELSEEEAGQRYGWTTDPKTGQRRAKRAKGRPSTKPRTTTPPPAPDKPVKPKDVPAKPDFTGPLADLTSALWMVAAAVPIPAEPLRIKVRAQAKILRENRGGLVQGVNVMAQNNGVIRRGVEMLAMGSGGWILPATMAVAPFCVQSAQMWKMDPAELVDLAKQTEKEWEDEFKAMTAAMGLGDPEPEEEPEAEEMAAT
jgi:hypothetical protein